MGLYHHFQTAITFANLIPPHLNMRIYVYKLETVRQNLCLERFDEDHFVQNL